MLIDIGTSATNAKGTHFFSNNMAAIIISNIPTTGKIYPSLKVPGLGKKLKNLFRPEANSKIPKRILTIVVNFEFIINGFIIGYMVKI